MVNVSVRKLRSEVIDGDDLFICIAGFIPGFIHYIDLNEN